MEININKKSRTPIYFQIQKQIREKIEKVSLKPNDQLPTERKLSADLGVSRVTIRKAIRGLVTEGLFEKKLGKGIFVADKKLLMNIQSLEGTTQFIEKFGYEIETSVIENKIIESDEKISNKLELIDEKEVLFLKRVRYVNEEAVIIDETYLPLSLYKGIQDEDFNKSLYSILREKYNMKPVHSKGLYNILVSGEDESEILNLKLNTPLLVKRAISYTENEVPIEYNITKYRTDKFEFVFDSKSGL